MCNNNKNEIQKAKINGWNTCFKLRARTVHTYDETGKQANCMNHTHPFVSFLYLFLY